MGSNVRLNIRQANAARCDGRAIKISGPAQSGKTEVLIERVRILLEQGISADKILVGTVSAVAADELRERLAARLETDVRELNVATVQRICTEVLSTDEAKRATGRIPYVLNAAEYKFALEDVKTLGTTSRKLRRMLDFIYRQWSLLRPESEWMSRHGEGAVIEYLEELLREQGAMLKEELAPICAQYLRKDDGARNRHAYEYVLWDEFQDLDKAQQTCVCLLAQRQLAVFGDEETCVKAASSYPYPKGFIEFDKLRRNVETHVLPHGHAPVRNSPLNDAVTCRNMIESSKWDDVAQAGIASRTMVWDDPESELAGISRFIASAALNHSADKILVIVPNPAWGRGIERSLGSCKIESSAICGAPLTGDPRNPQHAAAQVAYVKLALLAQPTNLTAWRCWIGFGNHLLNSDIWARLMAFSKQHGLAIVDAMALIADAHDEPFEHARIVAERYSSARNLQSALGECKGADLLRAIGADKIPAFKAIQATMSGNENAPALFDMVRAYCLDPYFAPGAKVRIIEPHRCAGIEAGFVFVAAAVNGFYPTREAFEIISTPQTRDRTLSEQRQAFTCAAMTASKHLAFSTFLSAPLELAEQSGMKINRVRYENGQRRAHLSTSLFVNRIAQERQG